MARVAIAVLTALLWTAPAHAYSKQDVSITAGDGVKLASTLYLPDGAAPAGGWPAIVVLHGLGGDRSSMNVLAERAFLPGEQYAVLTFDARGHGASGGRIGIAGPRDVADAREVFDWLAARPDVGDARIGAWGISLGGGTVWSSLVAGVPWAAVEVAQTWTDLRSALLPQGLLKSGVLAGFVADVSPTRLDPSVVAAFLPALAGNVAPLVPFTAARSSSAGLSRVTTPVFVMQGRRDFAFGLDQALTGFRRLAGPKRLWIGNHGHAPSTFPASDTPAMLAEGREWFDRFLRGVPNGIETRPPVALAPAGATSAVPFAGLPPTRVATATFRGSKTIGPLGTVVRPAPLLAAPVEVFGSPTVRIAEQARGGWAGLVATLAARTPAGKDIVVATGGVPTRPGKRTVTVALASQATFLPKGSRLVLTIAARSSGAKVYLAVPMPQAARLLVGAASVRMPVLSRPVSSG